MWISDVWLLLVPQIIKNESLEITFSFWDGSGHRRKVVVRKGDSVGDFLKACRDVVRPLLTSVLHVALHVTFCRVYGCALSIGLNDLRTKASMLPGECPYVTNAHQQTLLGCWLHVGAVNVNPPHCAQLAPDFRELRNISVSNLMYVKEDLIIPNQYTFYDLIINKVCAVGMWQRPPQ